jgi:putative ABC transport system ATP-binding protein
MSKQPIIVAEHIHQAFHTSRRSLSVLNKADIEIQENTFTIIYGPSGSGKSTLLNILSGLQKPTKGKVIVQGRDLYSLDENELAAFRANRIGIVYQTNYWVTGLSVIENVALPLNFLGYTRKQTKEIALLSLQRVGMEQYADDDPSLLSGGEQQRISLARAIVNTPLFIVADEPTGNLDIEHGNQVIELLQKYRDEFRCTIILVTHNIEYLPVGDNIYYVQDGTVEKSDAERTQAMTLKTREEFQKRLNKLKEPSL